MKQKNNTDMKAVVQQLEEVIRQCREWHTKNSS